MAKKGILISKDEYAYLLKQSQKMDLLEIGGVDNWEWYGESLNPEGSKDIDELEEAIDAEVQAMEEVSIDD